MPTPEQEELAQYISRIMQKTKDGQAEWTRVNPSTFAWTRTLETRSARIILQRVDRTEIYQRIPGAGVTRTVRNYFMQVTELPTNAQMVSINTDQDKFFAPLLEELFNLVSQNISRKGLDFLKEFLKS